MAPVARVENNMQATIARHFKVLRGPFRAFPAQPSGFPEKCPMSRFLNAFKPLNGKDLSILLNRLLPRV
jgi:hypothetical protein